MMLKGVTSLFFVVFQYYPSASAFSNINQNYISFLKNYQMKTHLTKDKLPQILNHIFKKHYRCAFTKFVLLEDTQDDSFEKIKHYDLECQAVNIIVDTFKNKIRALMFNFFIKMSHKAFKKKRYSGKPLVYKKTNYSFTNNIHQKSEKCKEYLRLNFQDNQENKPNKVNITHNPQREAKHKIFPHRKTMEFDLKQERSNILLQENIESFGTIVKKNKRLIILQKLKKIESDLSTMLSSDGSKANIFSVKTPSFQGFEAGEEDFIKKTGRTNCSPKMSRKEKKKFLSLLCQ